MIENLQPGTYRVVEVDGDKEHYNWTRRSRPSNLPEIRPRSPR